MNTAVEKAFSTLAIAEPQAIASGNNSAAGSGDLIQVRSPVDGDALAEFAMAAPADISPVLNRAADAFNQWRNVPAPLRGELVRRVGDALRENKEELATLVTAECGKIYQEALGEVQEMIDICDFAVGLSRQLYGLSIASERPQHRLAEQWHPLGPVLIISAFNFPVAVWAWNAMLALVCGDSLVWKPSEKTPLTALACHEILMKVIRSMPEAPDDLSHVIVGGADVGHALAADPRMTLVSATGSIPMGKKVAETVAGRLGKCLLELGGNNAAIVTPTADLELAVRGIVFSAVGTCGQRCTSLRRLIVHETIRAKVVDRLKKIYESISVGNPFDAATLVGPLVDEQAAQRMDEALEAARDQGGVVYGGGRVEVEGCENGVYVMPAIVEIDSAAPIVQQETFAPILYVLQYDSFSRAIEIQNGVPQGLSSAVFTSDVREAELFCSPAGSDCGIANVNIGTSGAEIGGAFGGEKETGGGRESGSDAWKNYMRRATNTINYSSELPLAQGIRFELD